MKQAFKTYIDLCLLPEFNGSSWLLRDFSGMFSDGPNPYNDGWFPFNQSEKISMQPDERPLEPEYDEIIVPESIELIDPQHVGPEATAAPPRRRRRIFRSPKRLAIWLFIATCVSTFLVGTRVNFYSWSVLKDVYDLGLLSGYVMRGLSYSVSLMAILMAHEMGHYLQARRYRVPASLPFFIPMPIFPFGTMGAVIVQGAGVANRKQMFDIAVTGPLAGLVLALPLAYYGVVHANVVSIVSNGQGFLFGDPLILQWMIQHVHGSLSVRETVELNPVLFAGWVGIFITALNMIPIGQLDGGHILYTLIGKKAHVVAVLLLWGAIFCMVFTGQYSYMLIVLLLFLMGPKHPPTADDIMPLGRTRMVVGWLTLAFIVIGFTPIPIQSIG